MKQFLSDLPYLLSRPLKAQAAYFQECGDDIARRNIQVVKYISFIACIATFGNSLIHRFMLDSGIDGGETFCFILFLFFFALACRKKAVNKWSTEQKMRFTVLFHVAGMISIAYLSVFRRPDLASVWFTPFLLIGPVLFLHTMTHEVLINISGYSLFVGFAIAFKNTAVWRHEVFESTVALILSMVTMYLLSSLQIRSNEQQTEYHRKSQMDLFTGLLNKTAVLNRLEEYISGKHSNEMAAVVFLDLDNFKYINDTFGHSEGDWWIGQMGSILASSFRTTDIVGRYGGDEFVVVMKDASNQNFVEFKLRAIQAAIEEIAQEKEVKVTCSAGAYCFMKKKCDAMTCLNKADELLYKAKAGGKNRYCIEFDR